MKSYPVNRLRFIKQLGLKAYSGQFPSANHTRYEHSIGTMHLSRQLCKQLYDNTSDLDLKGSIKEYQPTIETAALLHDIGHGPFSHVVDDILEYFGKDHEAITVEIIEKYLADEIKSIDANIDIRDVCSIILGRNLNHAYLNDIIHGHLDVDRMDYLARDAYFTATEYQWRAYSFIQLMRISKIPPRISDEKVEALHKEIEASQIPKREEITEAINRIKDLWTDHVCICNEDGVVHAEMMLITRRTMYENVYYETSSRIAENMISRAIMWMIEQDKTKESLFLNPENFVRLDDFELFALLKNSGGYAEQTVQRIKEGRFFKVILQDKVASMKRLKDAVARKDRDEIMNINIEVAKELETDQERVLLDIIKRKGFERNRVFVQIDDEAKPLEDMSGVIRALINSIEKEMTFGIYVDTEKTQIDDNKLKKVKNVLRGGEGE
jgi:hypothetical protein